MRADSLPLCLLTEGDEHPAQDAHLDTSGPSSTRCPPQHSRELSSTPQSREMDKFLAQAPPSQQPQGSQDGLQEGHARGLAYH